MDVYLKGTLMDNDSAAIMRWGYDWLDLTCPLDVQNALDKNPEEDATVYINSHGGILTVGSEIYGILRKHGGGTTAVIQSHAASAATIAMMGCDTIRSEPVATICIHNPMVRAEGDAEYHREVAGDLDTFKESVINAYMPRSKLSREELWALMDEDKWLTPQQALECGLIDEIIDGDKLGTPAPVLNATGGFLLPSARMREQYQQHLMDEKVEREKEAKRAQARLELHVKY